MSNQKGFIVTIDGPAGAGKSTISKAVARRFGLTYLDTGAMYRSVTCAAILHGISEDDGAALAEIAAGLIPDYLGDTIDYYYRGLYLTPFIRTIAVNAKVSEVSVHADVRRELVRLQRRIGQESPNGVVLEGRDTGSVVFPNASLKIYLTASVEERARRRYQEYLEQGLREDPALIAEQIRKRDRIDSSRAVSPLIVPEGALTVDSTGMSVEASIERICRAVGRALGH